MNKTGNKMCFSPKIIRGILSKNWPKSVKHACFSPRYLGCEFPPQWQMGWVMFGIPPKNSPILKMYNSWCRILESSQNIPQPFFDQLPMLPNFQALAQCFQWKPFAKCKWNFVAVSLKSLCWTPWGLRSLVWLSANRTVVISVSKSHMSHEKKPVLVDQMLEIVLASYAGVLKRHYQDSTLI